MADLVLLGAVVVIVGFLVIIISAIFGSRPKEEEAKDDRKKRSRTEVRGGGVVMIGPIPIIFGTDAKWTVVAIILALVLIIVSAVLTWRL